MTTDLSEPASAEVRCLRARQVELEAELARLRQQLASAQRQAAEAEAPRSRRDTRFEILTKAAGQLISGRDPDAVIHDLFGVIADHLDLDACFSFSVDGDRLRLASCIGVPPEVERELAVLNFGQAVCGTVAQRRESIYIAEVQSSQDTLTGFIRQLGIRAYACHPLVVGDRLLGTLSFGSRRRERFNDADLDFFATIATYVAAVKERKRAEEAVRASEQQLRDITDNLPVLISHIDKDQRYRFANKAYEAWFGRSPEELYGVRVQEAVGQEVYERVRPQVEAALAGERINFEWWASVGPHGPRYVKSEYIPRRQRDGTVDGFYVLATDLTEHKRSELALAESEARLHLAIDAGRMAIWESDAVTGTINGSRELNRVLGFPPDACPSADEIRSRFYPGERERLQEIGRTALARGDHMPEVEFRYVWPDGSVRWLLLRAHIHLGPDGAPSRYVGVVMDITDRKQADARLRENEQRLRATYEHAFVGIAEADPEGRFVQVNEQFCSITGYTRDELLARPMWEITHPDDRAADLEQFYRQMAGDFDAYTLEKRYVHKDGHCVWIELSASRVDDAAGRPLYGIRVVRDVTERKRAEEQQYLLIHELNHRVKNTLATVQSIAMHTLRNAASPGRAREDLEARLMALSRAHDVLTRENWEGAKMQEIVGQAIEPYSGRKGDRVHIAGPDIRIPPRMGLALAMALQELATNAVKYGALSNDTGQVRVTWIVDHAAAPPNLRLRWQETGGPPVQPPKRQGFGSRLIERSLAHDLGGSVSIEFAPVGVVCTVDAPIA